MTKQQEEFQKSVMHVLEAVMFENWLRFYFITEIPSATTTTDGRTPLFVAMPDKGMDRIKEDYSHLLSIVEDMIGQSAVGSASNTSLLFPPQILSNFFITANYL